MKPNEKWKAITIGGNLPGLGEFEHFIAIPVGLPTEGVLHAYQDKRFRKACVRFKTIAEAQKAVDEYNAGLPHDPHH